MMHNLILLDGLLGRAVEVVADHFIVWLLAVIILGLITAFKERLLNLSAVFVPVKVHGEWSTILTESTVGTPAGTLARATPQNEKPHEYVRLHQFFNKVWGDAFVQNEPKDVYRVSGRIIADKLALIFRDKEGFDTGAVLLKVINKDLMQGYEVGVDSATNFYSRAYTWRRRPNPYAKPSSGGH